MQKERFFITSKDHYQLNVLFWLPDGQPDSIVMGLHNIGEHGGRYDQLAERFNTKGIAFAALDFRGHGENKGKKGRGKKMERFYDDIQVLNRKLKEMFPHVPRFLYGHGMGATIALSYVLKRKNKLSGVIASAPWIRLHNPLNEMGYMFMKMLGFLNLRFSVRSRLKPEWMSRQPEVVEDYQRDRKVHDKISAALFLAMEEAARNVLRNKHKYNIPLLLMHGTKDKVFSYHGTKRLVKNTGEITHCRIWDGFYHELHNDIGSEEVFDYVNQWMEQHEQQAIMKIQKSARSTGK